MDTVTRTYTFRQTPSGLSPTSPRSLKDLQDSTMLMKAARTAESIQREASDVDTFLRSLDEKPQDTNHDFPGHVTVSDVAYGEQSISGGTVRSSEHPRKLAGTQATLTRPRFLWFPEKTDYETGEGGNHSRSQRGWTESVSQKDGLTTLRVSGAPGKHELLKKSEGPDFPLPSYQAATTFSHFKLDGNRHFDEVEPWNWADQSRITDPQKAADQGAAKAANQAIAKTLEVYQAALALDGSPVDLNDRAGEVLLQNAQVGERVLSGSIRPMYTRRGSTAENPEAGRFFDSELKPYMEMRSEKTEETFEAFFGKRFEFEGDYRDQDAAEIFVYSTPEQSVKARVGEFRSWYTNEEPGWEPHMYDDTAYPMSSDTMGGSIIIRK